jgi:excisionase family DNA binding protein
MAQQAAEVQEKLPHVLTVEEWAAKMRISRSAAYDAVKHGEVKVIRIGRLIRIPNTTA